MKVGIRADAREKFARMASSLRLILSRRQGEVFDRLEECYSVSDLAERLGTDRRVCLRILARLEEKCGKILKTFPNPAASLLPL